MLRTEYRTYTACNLVVKNKGGGGKEGEGWGLKERGRGLNNFQMKYFKKSELLDDE